MQKQAFIVTGLGYGDESKGSVVDWLTYRHKAHTVIRTGGPQALHRVVTSDGREHVFQQFGSGTFRGAGTHLSKHMLVAPHAFLRELDVLQPLCEHNVLVDTTVHKDALIVTPIQAVVGRVRELLRGTDRRGSVGVGVGEAVRDTEAVPDLVLHAHDLYFGDTAGKLANLWRYKQQHVRTLIAEATKVTKETFVAVNQHLAVFETRDLLEQTIAQFDLFSSCVRLVDDTQVAKEILGREGTLIIEGSQGVLLDRVHGFYPYTTKVRATPETGRQILSDGRYDGKVTSLGIVRSYATKHGRGPFVTEDAALTEQLPDAVNKDDPWQTKFRVGHFDAVATRYAATVCGAGAFDGLVVTCLDRTAKLKNWSICTEYQHEAEALPDVDGALMEKTTSLFDIDVVQPDSLSQFLSECRPVLRIIPKDKAKDRDAVAARVADLISRLLRIPLYAISCGETEQHKFLVEQTEHSLVIR